MRKACFIGHLGKGVGDFLVELKKDLLPLNIDLVVIACGQHEQAFIAYKYDDITISQLDLYSSAHQELFGNMEDLLFRAFPANIYILWSGYHGIFAKLRNFMLKMDVPHLIMEYSGIESAYLMDVGLHGEASPINVTGKLINYDAIARYIQPRYSSFFDDAALIDEINRLKKDKKLVLFLGVWDQAAGLTLPNTIETQRKLSPKFRSTYDVAEYLINNLPEDYFLVIKPHPYAELQSIAELEQLSNQHNNVIFVHERNPVSELLTISDVIVTITSTTFMLAVLQNKPLLLFGNTYPSILGSYGATFQEDWALKDALSSAISGVDKAGKAGSIFLSEYLLDGPVYTSDAYLMSLGLKSTLSLTSKVNELISNAPANWLSYVALCSANFDGQKQSDKTIGFLTPYKNLNILLGLDELLSRCKSLEATLQDRDAVVANQKILINEKVNFIQILRSNLIIRILIKLNLLTNF